MLKRESGYGTCEDVQLSLEGETGKRSLGTKFVGILWNEEVRWGYYMDEMRKRAGNHQAWRGGRAITYRHFVISPNPADNIDLDNLMDLTMAWVHEFFGTDIKKGWLGLYQVAVVPHDDNKNHILHSHVIVNNTNLEDWMRLQIDKKMNIALWDRLQEMSAARGLSAFASHAEYYKAKREAKAKAVEAKTEDGVGEKQ